MFNLWSMIQHLFKKCEITSSFLSLMHLIFLFYSCRTIHLFWWMANKWTLNLIAHSFPFSIPLLCLVFLFCTFLYNYTFEAFCFYFREHEMDPKFLSSMTYFGQNDRLNFVACFKFAYSLFQLLFMDWFVGMGSWALYCDVPSTWIMGLSKPCRHWREDRYLVSRVHFICNNVRTSSHFHLSLAYILNNYIPLLLHHITLPEKLTRWPHKWSTNNTSCDVTFHEWSFNLLFCVVLLWNTTGQRKDNCYYYFFKTFPNF